MKRNLLFFAVFAFSFGTHSFAQEMLLPDETFTIKVIEKNANGKSETMPMDELVLKSNQISATFSTKNGFPAVAYVVTEDAAPNVGTLIVTAQSAKDKNHTLKWSATIKGNTISGKAEHFFMGKLGGEYDFTGILKKKK